MLQALQISNYAIIDELDIHFSRGMNIITGETGAGKSIIIGALNLILGERADTTALVNKEKKCVIEGVFTPAGNNEAITDFFTTHDIDIEKEITVRREIATTGKSRSFINDTPVTLAQLQALSSLLVDLHQQFDTLQVGQAGFQESVLDALSGNQPLLKKYKAAYTSWQQAVKQLEALQTTAAQFEKEKSYNSFLFDELQQAAFKENELEEADAELKLLSNAEGIRAALARACDQLEEQEQPIVPQLKSIAQQLDSYTSYHKALPGLVERLRSVQIELQDISGELNHISGDVQYDPARIEALNERIATGYKLLKKHGVQSTNELLTIQQDIEEKLQAALHVDDDITGLQQQVGAAQKQVAELADTISTNRKKESAPFEKTVNQLLAQVGMPNAAIRVSMEPKAPAPNGADAVEFLFDANKSNQFKPVQKVASGGELSRLMLCIKSLVAKSLDMPTLIFDEIDTGISGEAAKQVGIIMKDLAKERQVLCITHQPQIAGKADAHYFVYKENKDEKIQTGIRTLDMDERVTTLAKMLSGDQPSKAALESAKEMIAG